jgi:hypothetical protein
MGDSGICRSIDYLGADRGNKYSGELRKISEMLGKPALSIGALPVPLRIRACTIQSTSRDSVSEFQTIEIVRVLSTRLPSQFLVSSPVTIGMFDLGTVRLRDAGSIVQCE